MVKAFPLTRGVFKGDVLPVAKRFSVNRGAVKVGFCVFSIFRQCNALLVGRQIAPANSCYPTCDVQPVEVDKVTDKPHFKSRLLSFVLAATLLGGNSVSIVNAAVKYTVTDLGTLTNGGGSSYARSINNSGQIAGVASAPSGLTGFAWHAVLWSNGGIIDLGTLPNGIYSQAVRINNVGHVAGVSDTGSNVFYSFVYSGAGLRTPLPEEWAYQGGFDSPVGLNDNDNMVFASGFWRDSDKKVINLNTNVLIRPQPQTNLTNVTFRANAINNNNLIVGSVNFIDGNFTDACLWQNGVLTLLRPFDLANARAAAVNDANQVVGNVDGLAFLYLGGGFLNLGPGAPKDINNNG